MSCSSRGAWRYSIPYDEIQKGGGGIHCSTMELVEIPRKGAGIALARH